MARLKVKILISILLIVTFFLCDQTLQAQFSVQTSLGVMVPMDDGARLATDIYRPISNKPTPALLCRLPYGRGGMSIARGIGMALAKGGLAFVIQDCRGRYGSEGEWVPFRHERGDGLATLRWLAAQPYCNGKIAGFGLSYFGYTQWAIAADAPNNLVAIAPALCSSDAYNLVFQNGVMKYMMALDWSLSNSGHKVEAGLDQVKAAKPLHVALVKTDDFFRRNVPFFDEIAMNQRPADPYWNGIDFRSVMNRVSVPVLCIGGWYDIFSTQTIADFNAVMREGQGAAKESRLIIGPWAHGLEHHMAGVDFGKNANGMRLAELLGLFYYHHLSGGPSKLPKVLIFTMGANEWQEFDSWPPSNAKMVRYFLKSQGHAASLQGEGRLSLLAPPPEEPSDSFVYNPDDPVITVGGAVYPPNGAGPADQREVEIRPDVLVYTSDILTEPVHVAGPVSLELFAASSAIDTDFTAKLVDVDSDGVARIICEGIIRARYRLGEAAPPTFLVPEMETRFLVDMGHTSHVFKIGHQVRLEVSSSNFPKYDRNRNTGQDPATDNRVLQARQTVFHKKGAESALCLTILR